MKIPELPPQLLNYGSALLTFFGFYVAAVFSGFLVRLFLRNFIGLDKFIQKKKLKFFRKRPLSWIAGEAVKWYIALLGLKKAVEEAALPAAEKYIDVLIQAYPKIILVVLFLLAGALLGEFLSREIFSDYPLLARITSFLVVLAFILTAVENIGINIGPLNTIFLVVITSFFLSVSLAFGIATGLALKEALFPMILELLRGKENE